MKCVALLLCALAFDAAQPGEAAFMEDACACTGAAVGSLSNKVKASLYSCFIQELGATQADIAAFKKQCEGARRRKRNPFVPNLTKRNPFDDGYKASLFACLTCWFFLL